MSGSFDRLCIANIAEISDSVLSAAVIPGPGLYCVLLVDVPKKTVWMNRRGCGAQFERGKIQAITTFQVVFTRL